MKEHAIVCTHDQVVSLLDGTQTRIRLPLNPQPLELPDFNRGKLSINIGGSRYMPWSPAIPQGRCPFGKPGDHLLVKEEHYLFGLWNVKRVEGRLRWTFEPRQDFGAQFDQMPNGTMVKGRGTDVPAWYKRSATSMPRWASRIHLEVISTRAELLQCARQNPELAAEGIQITDADCLFSAVNTEFKRTEKFKRRWDAQHRNFPWDTNPWVWVATVRRIKP